MFRFVAALDRRHRLLVRQWLAAIAGAVLLMLAPMLARAQGAGADSVMLQWTAPGDDATVGTATLYTLRMSTAPINSSNWGSASTVSGMPTPLVAGTRQSVVVRGLSRDTTYYFAVRTQDDAGNLAPLSNVVHWDWVFDAAPPAAPSGLSANRSGPNVQLTWSPNGEPDLGGYSVYRATTAGGLWSKLTGSLVANSNFLDAAVPAVTDVWYQVTASDISTNESARSAAFHLTLSSTPVATAADALGPVYPNPSRTVESVCMPLTLGGSGAGLSIDIVNTGGFRVRHLEVAGAPKCPEGVIWDGRNDAGIEVAPGVYRAWLVDSERRTSVKLVRQP